MEVLTRKGWRTLDFALRARKLDGGQIADGAILEQHLSAELFGDIDAVVTAVEELETVVYDAEDGVVASAMKLTELDAAVVAGGFGSYSEALEQLQATATESSASAEILSTLYAAGPSGSAATKVRFAATTTASGAAASIALQVAVNGGFGDSNAAMFLDALTGGGSRIRFEANDVVFNANRFQINRPQGGSTPVFLIDTSTNPDTIEMSAAVKIHGSLLVDGTISASKLNVSNAMIGFLQGQTVIADLISVNTLFVDKIQGRNNDNFTYFNGNRSDNGGSMRTVTSGRVFVDKYTKVVLINLSVQGVAQRPGGQAAIQARVVTNDGTTPVMITNETPNGSDKDHRVSGVLSVIVGPQKSLRTEQGGNMTLTVQVSGNASNCRYKAVAYCYAYAPRV